MPISALIRPLMLSAVLGTTFLTPQTISAAEKPEKADASPETEAEDKAAISSRHLQQEVMDFSDRYVAAVWQAIDDYVAQEPDPSKRVAALAWKIRFGSASMSIAASDDPRTGLLDMTTFITVGRWSMRRYWVPEVFGESAAPLNQVYTQMEKEIWDITSTVLTPPQRKALRALIEAWEAGNPQQHEVADIRLRNLEGVELSDFDPATTAKGILSSLKNLLRRVDRSLLYGERVMFYMERTPRILEQQTSLTLAQIGQQFPITRVQPDFDKLDILLDEIPLRLQAGIDHNQGLIKELLPEVRATVESGERLTRSLEASTATLRELSGKIDPTIDYAKTLQEATAALSHLDASVSGLNALLEKDPTSGHSRIEELTALIEARSKSAADDLFHRALILLGAFFAGVLVILIAIRVLFPRRPRAS